LPRSRRSRRPRWPPSPPGRVTKARQVTAITAPTVAPVPSGRVTKARPVTAVAAATAALAPRASDEGSPSHGGHGRRGNPRRSRGTASDVASQGGGAGPGRDRHRRARSAVRAGWRGVRAPEPRAVIGARPGSPGPQGRGGRGSRARDRSSEDHLGISSADFGLIRSRAIVGEGCIGWGASLLNGLVSRGPRPGHSRPSYVKITRLGRGRLGYPRDLGPEQIERPSEQLQTLAADRAQEADQITAP
jgi:hypothetical protein